MANDTSDSRRGRTSSLQTARAVPAFLVLVVCYVSYVVVGPLAIDYLFNPPKGVQKRVPAGIAITIVWFILLIPVAFAYLRLLTVVLRNPGYVPLGKEVEDDEQSDPPPEFWTRDVFVCDQNGLPIYCKHCHNWKPDRTHHNQDVGRCTMKMDHFCPWVGGVVGERAIKFFTQFLFYTVILTTYGTILFAFFVHENRSHVQWIVALALAGFFLLFTLGMLVNTLWLALQNRTTIEHIDAQNRTMLLAVVLPPELQPHNERPAGLTRPSAAARSPSRSEGNESDRPLTSDLDDPAHSRYFSNLDSNRPIRRAARSEYWKGTVTYPLSLPTDRPPLPAPPTRTFAILETPPGMNPWDLGSPWRNFKAVFGDHFHQWWLPWRHSPVCDHSSDVSWYPLGPQFEKLLEDVGLVQRPISRDEKSTVSSKKRRRKFDRGWQNGERPDGYWTQREIRRSQRRRQSDTRS
ncbi:palmitoyltransferase pfa5-like [Teratosphaeria destructans]|uniref:Palmitoyltransferase n=1 Tax=Teratosphaeria destructans TaxID=418781 RepID=A0A9W7SQ86_9PEZI|nr:palmitoyltransferase pfa5-like [Teratosphaeria destructans]